MDEGGRNRRASRPPSCAEPPDQGRLAIPLETVRLLLRPWHVSDAVAHREMWVDRDPRVPAHRRIDAEGRPTVEDLEDRIRDTPPPGSLGLLVVERKGTGDVLGYCGLIASPIVPEGEPEVAYELLRRARGQGYATEAARAVLGWARATGHRRVWATVRAWNDASLRVLAKLGFETTDRVERDAVHGDSLFLTKQL
ncbi:GNAT family N-acetyltransferase [Promicromonospora umidemergens]|uniref:GNAT family N-acetyltransferase n=1 Tax=Promicromonospora umidemergens TaxID=629679 RepID=UPI0020A54CEB|nr:GNAT family N-acetyltransferase [Promicromonospora umidemergens]